MTIWMNSQSVTSQAVQLVAARISCQMVWVQVGAVVAVARTANRKAGFMRRYCIEGLTDCCCCCWSGFYGLAMAGRRIGTF